MPSSGESLPVTCALFSQKLEARDCTKVGIRGEAHWGEGVTLGSAGHRGLYFKGGSWESLKSFKDKFAV